MSREMIKKELQRNTDDRNNMLSTQIQSIESNTVNQPTLYSN